LDLKPDKQLLLDTTAIHIDAFIPIGVTVRRIVTSSSKLSFPTGSIDRILCLESLHHSTQIQRNAFYAEALRVLKPGGKLVIGDVRRGSKEAEWLNMFVHLFNPSGHRGIFFSTEDADHIRRAGFSDVQTSIEAYHWNFDKPSEMVNFCRNLFGMSLATNTDIEFGLVEYLHPLRPGRKSLETKIPWELIYFVATKPN
jgi:SAM-dependent methyltransferase